jgi:hypothetical protein
LPQSGNPFAICRFTANGTDSFFEGCASSGYMRMAQGLQGSGKGYQLRVHAGNFNI